MRAAADSLDSTGAPLQVVHRDIKPSNVRLTAEAEVKVLDFGVARASFEGREAKTERVRYGSVGYMAPERLLGGDETSAGDVFSLGVVLYELLLQKTYGRSELGPDAQRDQVGRGADELKSALLARGHTAEDADAVASLFSDMLQYEPESRPSTLQVEERVRGLVIALPTGDLGRWCLDNVPALEALSGHGEEAGLTGRVLAESDQGGGPSVNSQTIALPVEQEGAAPSGTIEVHTPTASRVPMYAGAAVGAVIVLGLGGWWALAQGDAPTPAATVAGAHTEAPVAAAPTDQATSAEVGTPPASTEVVAPDAAPSAADANRPSPSAAPTAAQTPRDPPTIKPVAPRDGALAPRPLTAQERSLLGAAGPDVANDPLRAEPANLLRSASSCWPTAPSASTCVAATSPAADRATPSCSPSPPGRARCARLACPPR